MVMAAVPISRGRDHATDTNCADDAVMNTIDEIGIVIVIVLILWLVLGK
jgi:hypothetical protein